VTIAPPSPDLLCTGCGYNLRGLDERGNCPECGQPLSITLHHGSIARPAWLRTTSRGALLLGSGLLLGALSFAMARATTGDSLWLFPLAALLTASGTWILAATPPGRIAPPHQRWVGTAMRVFAVATYAFQLHSWFIGVLRESLSASMFALLARLLLFTWAMASMLTCWRASFLATVIGDRSGAVQARILAILAPTLLVICAERLVSGSLGRPGRIGLAAALSIVATWSAIFFLGFAAMLARAARAESSC
jgi:hypothetical protein